ncbi:MAG: LamG-like jellyroll fold domain-containing protein, partial [Pontibacterium sp.]
DASDVAGAEFGDVCGGGGLTAPPATDDGPAAGSCEAIFADGVQSHSSSGQVIFNWQSKVLNSPDKIIATPKISDSSGGTSCGDQACSATFSPSEKIDFNAYSTGGSRISMSYNSDLSITPGTYSSVSVAGKGTLTLASGDYYISGNFTMDWQSNLEITGSDPVRIFVNGFFAGGGQTDINKGGDADKLFVLAKRGLTFNTQDEAVGFFYSEGTVSLGHLSEVTGAVSGERVTLGSTGATIIYDQAALGNASFGDICAATGNTINPPKLEYRFDDCSIENQLSDSSANGYHGTPYLADAEDGVVGQAIDLSSSGRGYIQLPEAAFDNLGDFTVSAWINLDSEGSWLSPNVLVSAGPGLFVLSELHISLYSRQVSVRTSGASASISHTHNLVGSWNHLTVSRTGNQVCVYINGALVGCDTTNDRPLDVSTNDDALIGRFN